MKILNNMPEEGNFVAVWEYEGKIWSDSFLFIDGVLHIYREYNDEGMFDDWDKTRPEDHAGLAYNPILGNVSNRYFVVKG